jgi:S-methylmethionine-dependent homocysteine/selenocysteine methylase
MKRLKALLKICESWIEERWQKLSAKKQKKFVVLFFAGYLVVTACVILTVWYDAKADASMRKNELEHIRNPILQNQKQLGDSSSNHLKNQEHERK